MTNGYTILLTGGSGMVGRNIIDRVAQTDHRIVAPRRHELDLGDPQAVQAFVGRIQPDAIIHAAGRVGGIQANLASPVAFLEENVMMGRNIILAARNANVARFLNLASSCMYPRDGENPLTEDMILTGELEPTNEGYALSKIFSTRLGEYINREEGQKRFKTLIPCNLFGLHDSFAPDKSHLIPAIIAKVHEAKQNNLKAVEIWGTGEARREFMFASDAADGIMRAIDLFDTLPEVMNLGLGYDHSVNDYYAEVARVIGWAGEFTHDLNRPTGMEQKLVSVARQNEWGWRATTSLESALHQTYQHYLEQIS